MPSCWLPVRTLSNKGLVQGYRVVFLLLLPWCCSQTIVILTLIIETTVWKKKINLVILNMAKVCCGTGNRPNLLGQCSLSCLVAVGRTHFCLAWCSLIIISKALTLLLSPMFAVTDWMGQLTENQSQPAWLATGSLAWASSMVLLWLLYPTSAPLPLHQHCLTTRLQCTWLCYFGGTGTSAGATDLLKEEGDANRQDVMRCCLTQIQVKVPVTLCSVAYPQWIMTGPRAFNIYIHSTSP